MASGPERACVSSDDFFLSEFVCAVASNDSCDPTKIGVADPTSPLGRAVMDALRPSGDRPPESNE